MPRRIPGILAGAVVMAIVLARPAFSSPPETRLPELLTRMDRVASLYRDKALSFTCVEKVSYGSPLIRRRTYLLDYVYEFNGVDLTDYRTDHKRHRPAGEIPHRVELANYRIPYSLSRAYSWVFVFERSRWGRYRFEILGDERALGRKALRVRMEPVSPIEEDVNDWYGDIWIDRGTWQLLRVEALKADQHEEKLRLEAALSRVSVDGPESYEIARIMTEFSVEKNGMRFPGLVEIVNTRYKVLQGRKAPYSVERNGFIVTQRYLDYRFFGVRTEDWIRDIVGGAAGGSGAL